MEVVQSETAATSRYQGAAAHSQRNMEDDTLQEVEAPPIVHLTWHEPLLHDSKHWNMLVCLDHGRGVAGKKRAQQRNKSRDGAFLAPSRRCEKEGKKSAIVNGNASV